VPRVSSASSFLPASALFFPPQPLAELRWTRRAMRPTNFCHLNDLRAPVLRAFSTHSAAFTAWTLPSFEGPACAGHEVLGFVQLDRGTECFTALENASADRCKTRAACFASRSLAAPRGGSEHERGRFLPTALAPTKPLTPLSPLPLPQTVTVPSHRPLFRRSSPALTSCRVRACVCVRKPPRSP
jgi:hypothetical protein